MPPDSGRPAKNKRYQIRALSKAQGPPSRLDPVELLAWSSCPDTHTRIGVTQVIGGCRGEIPVPSKQQLGFWMPGSDWQAENQLLRWHTKLRSRLYGFIRKANFVPTVWQNVLILSCLPLSTLTWFYMLQLNGVVLVFAATCLVRGCKW